MNELESLRAYFGQKERLLSEHIAYSTPERTFGSALQMFLQQHYFLPVKKNMYARRMGEKTAVVLTQVVTYEFQQHQLFYAEIPVTPDKFYKAFNARHAMKGFLSGKESLSIGLAAALAAGGSAWAGFSLGETALAGVTMLVCGSILCEDMNRMNAAQQYDALRVTLLRDTQAVDAVVESDQKVDALLEKGPYTPQTIETLLHNTSFVPVHPELWLRHDKEKSTAAETSNGLRVIVFPETGNNAVRQAKAFAAYSSGRRNFTWPYTLGVGMGTASLMSVAVVPVLGLPWIMTTTAMGAIAAAYYAKDMEQWNRQKNQELLQEQFGHCMQVTDQQAIEFILHMRREAHGI
ncbi:hypothetical protein HY639_00445 [Candidatus Woesearchaeota archaeon]|nr:hypothetical protein [Candidatus Woesearchaeota archaeon]